ncbi:MAG: Hsp20/alpha crystallin family protein [Opitutus sp.]
MSLLNSFIPSRNCGNVQSLTQNSTNDLGPTVKPVYNVEEAGDAFGLTVLLPGVTKETLEITAEAGELRLVGRRVWKQPEGWTSLYRESVDVPFALTLTYDNALDADKIAAEIRDGVLRVSLPKTEALKPRKITVG